MAGITQSPVFRTAVTGLGLTAFSAMLFYFLATTSKNGEACKNWPTVKAEITESRLRGGRLKKRKYRPKITYTYQVGQRAFTGNKIQFGEMATSQSKAQTIVNRFPIGKIVDLHYNPEDPEIAVLLTGVGGGLTFVRIISWIVLITGILILAAIPYERMRGGRRRGY